MAVLNWWRDLIALDAWHSMGYVLVPLVLVFVPFFLWQITKLHFDD